MPEELTSVGSEQRTGRVPWRKLAFAMLILSYFLYFNWDGLRVRFAADDMMNMIAYWRLSPSKVWLDLFTPWRGAFRPIGGVFYLPLLQCFGLNPLPYHAAMLAILVGNLYLMYRFARRIGCGELQSGLATLIVAYHAGLSMLYYSTAYIYDVLCFSFYMGAFLVYARVRSQGRLLRGGGQLWWLDCTFAPSTRRRWRLQCQSCCWPTSYSITGPRSGHPEEWAGGCSGQGG